MPSLLQGGRHRKAQALPLSGMARNKTGDPRGLQRVRLKAKTSKKEWKWQGGIVTHLLSGSQWNRGYFMMKKIGSPRSTRIGAYQQKASRDMLPRIAPCKEERASGERVVGLWCSWIVMRRWGLCTGCMAQWRLNLRSNAPSRGRS